MEGACTETSVSSATIGSQSDPMAMNRMSTDNPVSHCPEGSSVNSIYQGLAAPLSGEEATASSEEELTEASTRVVCKFFLANACRFGDQCHNKHVGKPDVKSQKGKSASSRKKKRRNVAEEAEDEKKQRMKTAQDVIKRIQWDQDLPQEHFTLGYLDRFKGLVEEAFTAFTWENLASLDWDTLAIPQHRIQYFKYKDEKVWDKLTRLDLVFGSTSQEAGQPTENIYEVMARVDSRIRSNEESELNTVDDTDDSDSDDDDNEIGINYRCLGGQADKFSIDQEDRSTHFLAVKLNNASIRDRLMAVQSDIIKSEEILRDCCMRPSLFHITLAMLRLPNITAIQAAVDVVEQFMAPASPLLLDICGLNHFGQRVVYAEVKPRDMTAFDRLVTDVRDRLNRAQDVKVTNSFDFVPHLTLAKVSRPIARMRRSKYIPSSAYAAHKSVNFGTQALDNLQLCIIEQSTRYDGFYTTLAEKQLTF